MRIATDGWEFDFTDAINVFKFDNQDRNDLMYHGAPMKAVDIIVELASNYLFIEVKAYDNPEEFLSQVKEVNVNGKPSQKSARAWLIEYLKYKYRDSFLYRYAENKIDKPIIYLCLLNFDSALNRELIKNLHQQLPVRNKYMERWKKEIVNKCYVLNEIQWNEKFPKWQVKNIIHTE